MNFIFCTSIKNKVFLSFFFFFNIEDIQMFLWGQAVQLPPEAQVVHEGRGNQEHQQYQENPIKKESNWNCNYRTVIMFICL